MENTIKTKLKLGDTMHFMSYNKAVSTKVTRVTVVNSFNHEDKEETIIAYYYDPKYKYNHQGYIREEDAFLSKEELINSL